MSKPDPIAFSEDQQFAVIGHALGRRQLWHKLDDMKVTKEWLVNGALRELWANIEGYRKKFGAPPPTQEALMAHVETVEAETEYVEAAKQRVAKARALAKRIPWEGLEAQLLQWSKAEVVLRYAKELQAKYNAGDHPQAFELWEQGANELRRLDLHRGARDQMIESPRRAKTEAVVRQEQRGKHLKYGVDFLDDAFGGIMVNDFILLGGYTGCGKTELARIIAENNARNGKKVGFFALEAEEDEIERRIKFAYMMAAYQEKHPDYREVGHLNYLDFRFGRLNDVFEPFEAGANAYVEENLANLNTYYRSNSDFSLETLDREILRHHEELDLVVLDHLHYVDSEGENENQEMHRLVKKIRDLVLGTGVPVVAIVHLRKKTGGETHTIMPSLDTIHGSSNIQKIATTAILMGRARGLNVLNKDVEPHDYHTFIRPAKLRLDGSRTNYVGLTFFNPYKHTYAPHYAIGRLNPPETAWNVLEREEKPTWAKNATIWEIGGNEE